MNNLNHRLVPKLVMAGTLLSLAPSAYALDIDFNFYTGPADNDLVNNFLVGDTFQQTTAGGITGGAVASQGGSATYRNAQGHPTTVSIAFRYDGMAPPGGGPSARLGWVGELTPVEFGRPSLYFSGEFYNDGSFTVLNNPTGQGGGMGTFMPLGTITTPPLGHWFALTFAATPLGGADYRLALSFDDLGSSGLDNPIRLFSGSTQVINGSAAADVSMFPGFSGYYRAPYYDNFSLAPVPEVDSLILFGFGAVLLACTRSFNRTGLCN